MLIRAKAVIPSTNVIIVINPSAPPVVVVFSFWTVVVNTTGSGWTVFVRVGVVVVVVDVVVVDAVVVEVVVMICLTLQLVVRQQQYVCPTSFP